MKAPLFLEIATITNTGVHTFEWWLIKGIIIIGLGVPNIGVVFVDRYLVQHCAAGNAHEICIYGGMGIYYTSPCLSVRRSLRFTRRAWLEADHDLYIYPTAYGYTLQHSKPPFGLQHVVVPPRGLPAYRVSAAGCEVAQAGA